MTEHPMSCEHLMAGAEAEAAYLMVVLEYYDGPTGGVMQCQICFAEYRFTMLDWDDHQGERVYSLAPLPPRSFEQVVAILSAHEPPKWPLWFPLRQHSSQQVYDLVERQLAEIVGKAGLTIKVFAMPQWGERIIAIKALSAGDLQDVQSWFALEAPTAGRDWFSFLGLVREAAT